MCAKPGTGWTGSCGAGVVPSRVWFGAAAVNGRVDAFEGVVAKALAVGALSSGAEAQAAFKAEGGGKGGEAPQDSKVLCPSVTTIVVTELIDYQ